MANGKSTYQTALANSGANSLHVRPKQTEINLKQRALRVDYAGLANEDADAFVELCSLRAAGAFFDPARFRIFSSGPGSFSIPAQFAKLTTVDGVRGISRFDAAFTRSSTTCTVTTTSPHGFSDNQVLNVTASSDTAAVPNGTTGIIFVTSPTQFTFTCPNAGAVAGTLTVSEYVSDLRQATYSRTTTTLTVTTQGAHGFATGDRVSIAYIDSAPVIALGTTAAITFSTGTSFTVPCINAGNTSGSLTLARPQGNYTPLTTKAVYTQSANYTGVNVANANPPPPVFRREDKLILVWGTVTTPVPVTSRFTVLADYYDPS